MRKAVGILIVLYGLSLFFESSMRAADGAATESFRLIEVAAQEAQQQIQFD